MADNYGNPAPVGGLIGAIMNMRDHMRDQQQQQQAFKTKQTLDNHNASVKQIMDTMTLGNVAEPVNGDNTITKPTTSYSVPSAVPGLPDSQTGVSGGNIPVDPTRQIGTEQKVGGGTQQWALKSPQQMQTQADAAAANVRQNKAADITSEEGARQDALEQAHLRSNEIQLQSEGGGSPMSPEFAAAYKVSPNKRDGTPMMFTSAQQQAATEALAKLNEQNATTRKTAADAQKAEQENTFVQNLKPQDIHTAVDQTVPNDTLDHAALNKRTHTAVNTALLMGDKKAAIAALKDAGDQLGRTETAVATAKGTVAPKIEVSVGTQNAKNSSDPMTGDDYSRAGQEFAITGQMPSLGRDKTSRAKIEHAAQEYARDNGYSPRDMVTMRAAYAGDKDSLKKFQTNRDQIVSFEQTAGKNLDQFLDLASKVPDTGSPWLNLPLRQLSANLVGSSNMAAVNAARQVATNEIAKVTSGGGMGGVLSDSARKEVENYNPQNATLAQTVAVAKVLKQDMANRHGAMDATLNEIKGRIGGTGNTPQTNTQQATHRFNPQTGKIEVIQ